ncbi:Early nodulin-like protein [Actinidia chinensis var. chinensis]|uniref:Early nodulin-like protein n=1 Tax=Actinidia chinensis var. chinensis TaxID=1590841 RepID=A0A2R6QN09_ACTCC|nr:Early nodulin-like protein [Actinidia chinensis var. chinensis]
MGSFRSTKYQFLNAFIFLLMIQTKVFSYQYKVGDLDAWGLPTPANPKVYTYWSKNHIFKIGDSLLFLYPPSQDSVIQVTEQSYNSCNLKDPILYMNNGNSLFNITKTGDYYFTSGSDGHCEKSQKLRISVPGNGSSASSPSYGPGSLPATAPSYPTVFGSIPMAPLSSPSSSSLINPAIFLSSSIGFLICAVVSGFI